MHLAVVFHPKLGHEIWKSLVEGYMLFPSSTSQQYIFKRKKYTGLPLLSGSFSIKSHLRAFIVYKMSGDTSIYLHVHFQPSCWTNHTSYPSSCAIFCCGDPLDSRLFRLLKYHHTLSIPFNTHRQKLIEHRTILNSSQKWSSHNHSWALHAHCTRPVQSQSEKMANYPEKWI